VAHSGQNRPTCITMAHASQASKASAATVSHSVARTKAGRSSRRSSTLAEEKVAAKV